MPLEWVGRDFPVPPFDLTGGWSGDDGGWYFIRQLGRSVTWTGLHNSGFHWGIEFANVFQGQISADDTTLSGEWADVPRGGTNNAGTISLRIVRDSLGLPRQLDRIAAGTTGGGLRPFGQLQGDRLGDHVSLGQGSKQDLVAAGQPLDRLVLAGLALGDPGRVDQPGPGGPLPVGQVPVLGVENLQQPTADGGPDRIVAF